MMKMALAFILALFLGGAAQAQAQAEPAKVTVGSYLHQVTSLNLRDNQVNVDFYIWFRWTDETLNPLETFELMNGTITERTPSPVRKLKDVFYGQTRVQAVLNQSWDVHNFPLDTQTIRLEIEDSEWTVDRVVYVPDTENSNVDPDVKIPGYDIAGTASTVKAHTYQTNYGDITLAKNHQSTYSRYTQGITLVRPDSVYYLKTFSTIFISSMVAFLAFLVKPTDLDPRFGLGIGALFAVVASYFIIAGELPHSSGFTLSDQVNLASMGMIFLSLMQSSVSLMVHERDPAKSLKLDRISLIAFPVAYALLCVVISLP